MAAKTIHAIQTEWLCHWGDLSERERMPLPTPPTDERTVCRYFVYNGTAYDIREFTYEGASLEISFPDWTAYYPTNLYSGVVIKIHECQDKIDVGVYRA